MPNTLGRNLNLCFTKIKRPLTPDDDTQSNFLSPDDHNHQILIKSYNSLYDHHTLHVDDNPSSSSSSSPSSSSAVEPADFAAVFASQRFFFSSPGRSNSIIDSTPSIATNSESSDTLLSFKTMNTTVTHQSNDGQSLLVDSENIDGQEPANSPAVKDGVAVPTYSPDPYMDFRRSMQEMVEARDLVDVNADWEYLHELLLCYLSLNPKSTHKFIIKAFADLLVSLLTSAGKQSGGGSRERTLAAAAGGCEISRQCM
ncbi:hypothetical protein Tsubulata_042508 [Turnera subulata]|uniref:Transcription repressor n=1 Tax=Turnera subulata TaxID=218843 RepID=A0A9Q0F0K3_9ROSI|nr:hypothetical protein Tsubulata_042508 [Turnera subulata]